MCSYSTICSMGPVFCTSFVHPITTSYILQHMQTVVQWQANCVLLFDFCTKGSCERGKVQRDWVLCTMFCTMFSTVFCTMFCTVCFFSAMKCRTIFGTSLHCLIFARREGGRKYFAQWTPSCCLHCALCNSVKVNTVLHEERGDKVKREWRIRTCSWSLVESSSSSSSSAAALSKSMSTSE